ncbi:nuclear transport factor 2 family protein [Amycolatopsis sp. Poz14]|uniref:nuclear transport factor 2 family protein n=1 Tax=Amycolatopsis sp. Poz14 TaxID=1447705 RepID=UPI001EE7EEFE|nr:nuclear transport factor 2 family protein [Amycolatopsis sp. Poz14]MCG3754006.1 nuclear transport factor 2 family protein [Amycolatopsis sp. Poz14]
MNQEAAVQQLLDRAEIEQLRGEYAMCFDAHDLDGAVACYAPDGEVQVGGDEPVRGRETLREWYGELNELMGEWSHHYTSATLRIVSQDEAEGRLYWLVPANWSDGRAHLQAGQYHDIYRKIDGRWRIQRRHATWFWSRFMEWPGNWAQRDPLD